MPSIRRFVLHRTAIREWQLFFGSCLNSLLTVIRKYISANYLNVPNFCGYKIIAEFDNLSVFFVNMVSAISFSYRQAFCHVKRCVFCRVSCSSDCANKQLHSGEVTQVGAHNRTNRPVISP